MPQEAPVLARGSATNENQVQLTWNAINSANNGGTVVTGYSILWDNGSGTANIPLTTISSAATLTYTQTTGLVPGSVYNYIISAVNVIGTGVQSSSLAVTVAYKAEQLGPVTTTLNGLNARIAWPATASYHSSAVSAYKILIKKADGTYLESSECDGANPTTITNMYCDVQMSTLTGATYSLTAGTPVIA